MSEYLLRKRLAQRHQEDRPVYRMETDNVLSDQMKIRRPELPVLLAAVSVGVIAETGDIVGQCVQPYIYDMLVIKVYRNSPFEGCSGYTEILKPRKQEVVHHLILSGYRLNKFRMFIDVFNQSRRIFAHSEEICLLLCPCDRPSAVRALAVHQLGIRPEGLARRTVPSLIMSLVDIALLIELLENLLDLSDVIRICRADEFVVGGIHQIPDPVNLSCHVIYILLRRTSLLLGLVLNLLAVLVRTGLKIYLISLHPAESRNTVRKNDLICITDMGFPGRICNSRRNVIILSCMFYHSLITSSADR